jgi:hypothetical protein
MLNKIQFQKYFEIQQFHTELSTNFVLCLPYPVSAMLINEG